jgi:hypothetical protein
LDEFWTVFGDLGTWVSGLATFAAVVVAVFYSQLQERRAREQSLHNVYAWMQKSPQGPWQIVVSNGTGAPIYDWSITIQWDRGGEEVWDGYTHEDFGILPPAQKTYPLAPEASEVLPDNDAKIRMTIEFVDRNLQRWSRSSTDELQRVNRRGARA